MTTEDGHQQLSPSEQVQNEKRVAIATGLTSDMLDHGTYIFDNPKLYDFLGEDLEATREVLRKQYRWSMILGPKIVAKRMEDSMGMISKRLGEKFIILLADPGITARVHEFVRFAEAGDTNGSSPHQLREQFSDHLGTKTVYRGMAITDSDLDTIRSTGMFAQAFYQDQTKLAEAVSGIFDYQEHDDAGFERSFLPDLENRIRSGYASKPYITIAVSGSKEIAESVGWWYSSEQARETGKPHLFTMNLPALNLITPTGIFDHISGSPGMKLAIGKKVISYGSSEESQKVWGGKELFVPYYIAPKDITNIETFNVPLMPRWLRQ